jgi:ATP-dependent RNA helicase RhlE
MQKLVIDEFDEMLNLGLEPNWPLSYDAKSVKTFFSATMTDEVDAILNDYFDYPEEVTLQHLEHH